VLSAVEKQTESSQLSTSGVRGGGEPVIDSLLREIKMEEEKEEEEEEKAPLQSKEEIAEGKEGLAGPFTVGFLSTHCRKLLVFGQQQIEEGPVEANEILDPHQRLEVLGSALLKHLSRRSAAKPPEAGSELGMSAPENIKGMYRQ